MADWERFEADIFPGRAWRLTYEGGEIQVVENPEADGVILFTAEDPSRWERAKRAVLSNLPLVSYSRSVEKTGLPFDSAEDAKELGEVLAEQFAANAE